MSESEWLIVNRIMSQMVNYIIGMETSDWNLLTILIICMVVCGLIPVDYNEDFWHSEERGPYVKKKKKKEYRPGDLQRSIRRAQCRGL